MSLHFIIDAYNLIKSTHSFGEGNIQSQTKIFFDFLNQHQPAGSARNQVTVVFDGRSFFISPQDKGNLHILFSHNREADTLIKNIVDEEGNPANLIVVTNDRALQKWVKGAKAKVLPCEDFMRMGSVNKGLKKLEKPNGEQSQNINDEFRKIWKI